METWTLRNLFALMITCCVLSPCIASWILAYTSIRIQLELVYTSIMHFACAEGVHGNCRQFMSTPRSITSGQHLWSIASLSMAGKYNHIPNRLENCWGARQIFFGGGHGKSDICSIYIWANFISPYKDRVIQMILVCHVE